MADASCQNEPSASTHRPRIRPGHVIFVATGVAVALFLLWWVRWVVALAFAAILLGIFFRGGADLLARGLRPIVRLSAPQSLTLFMFLLVLLTAAFVVLAVPSLSAQVDQLSDRLPQSYENLRNQVRQTQWGQWLLEESPVAQDGAMPQDGPEIASRAVNWASSAVTGVIAVLFIFFTGLYLASEPGLYQRGVLWLVPPHRRKTADRALSRANHALRWWLVGQMVSMTIVGVLVGIGLWILGAPMPVIHGVLAALLEFIPNVGPFIAGGLPTLLSLTAEGRFFDGTSLAIAVVIMFLSIQALESYLITPLVQRRAVELPPALLITTQLTAGLLLGAMGVVIAAPLVVVLMVLAKELLVVGDPKREHPKDRSHEENAAADERSQD